VNILTGERKVTFRIDEEIFWSLKQLALDKKTNATVLLEEALREYLVKHKALKK
jgi:predicted transcriptional regulator